MMPGLQEFVEMFRQYEEREEHPIFKYLKREEHLTRVLRIMEPVRYGATCSKCSTLYPDAEIVEGFTCYACRKGI